jgi:hypothetical protein
MFIAESTNTSGAVKRSGNYLAWSDASSIPLLLTAKSLFGVAALNIALLTKWALVTFMRSFELEWGETRHAEAYRTFGFAYL